MQTSRKAGMSLMTDSLFDLVKRDIVTPEEAWVKASDKTALAALFKNANIEVPKIGES